MKRSKTKFFSKKILLGALLWVSVFWILGMGSTTQAASTIFGKYLAFQSALNTLVQMHSIVHFWVWWNNFWGSFLWWQNDVTLNTPVVVQAGSDMRCCRQQLQWLYYNSQRWDRLFSFLGQSPSEYNVSWGLYTQCSKITDANQCTTQIWDNEEQDPYGIYWTIKHDVRANYRWGREYYLMAWVKYNMSTNRMESGLQCNFQLIGDKKVPMGYIYDSHGHIWLVWAEISWSNEVISNFHTVVWTLLDEWRCMNQIFNYNWEDIEFCVQPLMSEADKEYCNDSEHLERLQETRCKCDPDPCRNGVCIDHRNVIIWDGGEIDMAAIWLRWTLWATTDVWEWSESSFDVTKLVKTETSVSDVVNTANKNAEQYCRNKWKKTRDGVLNDVTCVDFINPGTIEVDADDLYGKTLIVRNWDVKLTSFTTKGEVEDSINNWTPINPMNIFIDKWNLYLKFTADNSLSIEDLASFTQEGYATNSCDVWTLTVQRELSEPIQVWVDDDGNPIYQTHEDAETESMDLCNKAAYLKWNFIINGLLIAWDSVNEADIVPLNSKLYIHWKLISFNSVTDTTASRKRAIQSVLESRTDLPEIATWAIELVSSFAWSCNQWWIWSDSTWCNGDGGQNSFNFKKLWIVDMTFKTSDLWGGVNLFK